MEQGTRSLRRAARSGASQRAQTAGERSRIVSDPREDETGHRRPRLVSHAPLLFVVLLAGAYFLYFYAGHPDRPGMQSRLGWFGWFDQGEYLKEARAIRQGVADPERYQYPLGYPFLGSLFIKILPYDPFLLPNLAAFVATIGLFFETCKRYLGPAVSLFGCTFLMFAAPLTNLTVIPWTTTPALLTIAFWAWVALARERLGYSIPVIGGVLLAVTFASRGGGEILLLAPLGGAMLWQFRKEEKLLVKAMMLALIFAAGFGLNQYWTQRIFGQPVHPYFEAVLARGFRISSIPTSLRGALVYSGREGEFWDPLFRQGFWLVLAPLGFVVAFIKRDRRLIHAALLIGLVGGLLVPAAFPAFNAVHLKYHALHYIKAWFPVAGFYALYGVHKAIVRA